MEVELIGMEKETAELFGRALAIVCRKAGGTLRLSPAELSTVLQGELSVAFNRDGSATFFFIEDPRQ